MAASWAMAARAGAGFVCGAIAIRALAAAAGEVPPPLVGGLSSDADGLADTGPTSSGTTGLNNSLIEVRLGLPKFPRRLTQRR